MQYAILIYESDADFSARADAERQDSYWAGWRAYSKALADSGVMRGGAPLQGAHAATTVRMKGRGRRPKRIRASPRIRKGNRQS